MTFCPYCGVRQQIDLREINFRDLGAEESMPCPHCETALDVIEFETDPPVTIERCTTCYGMFFNPGELEYLLEQNTNPFVWLDFNGMEQIAADFGNEREIVYRKCPLCAERMHHINFGGRSGVILDQCGKHGVWVEGGELRRLMEWWRAGGKHVHQAHEAERARRIFGELDESQREAMRQAGSQMPRDWSVGGGPTSGGGGFTAFDAFDVADLLVGAVKGIFKAVIR